MNPLKRRCIAILNGIDINAMFWDLGPDLNGESMISVLLKLRDFLYVLVREVYTWLRFVRPLSSSQSHHDKHAVAFFFRSLQG
jgi:hypothetical protein